MANESVTKITDEQADVFQRFQNFLKSFRTESGSLKYREMIQRLPVTGGRSVVIDFNELLDFDPQLARQVIDDPEGCLKSASDAVKTIVDLEDRDYVTKIAEAGFDFKARLRNVTTGKIKLRMIRANHIGKLIMVDGIITRVSEVKPQLLVAVFECNCGQKLIVEQYEGRYTPPIACTACKREGPFNLIVEDSKFVDWQKVRIQEMPEELPPGQMPRSVDAIVKDDLVDAARPGDRVAIIGILLSVQDFAPKRGRLTTFRTYIDSNYVDTMDKESEKVEITPEEERIINELSKDEWIHQKIVKSIAPSIYGLDDVKEAIALTLFGGVPKTLPDGVKIRGEINTLLVGDPGTAKSVHGSQRIYVGRQTSRGTCWERQPIGNLIDDLMARRPQRIISRGDTQILALDREDQFLTQALDPITLKTRESTVFEVSRHQAKLLIHIRTRSGRSVIATPDHSFTTIENGKLRVLPANDLKLGAYLPVARHVELDMASPYIDLIEEFPKEELVSSETVNAQVPLVDTGQANGRRAASVSNVSANTFSRIVRGYVRIPDGCWLRRTRDLSWFPRFLDLTPTLGRILGLYLAEGNVEGNNVRITALYRPIRKILRRDFDEVFGKSSTTGQAVLLCQASIASWFKRNFGTGALSKQTPSFFLTAPYPFRCSLLAGYFSGDGTVDSKGVAVTASTRSIKLAHQISDLLATLGIFATIKRRVITKGRYRGRIYWILRIQGTGVLEYNKHIGFISPIKAKKLRRLAARIASRKHYQSRDVIPDYGALLKNATRELAIQGKRGHWTRNFLAELRGKTKRQRMGREYLQKVVSILTQLWRPNHQSPSLDSLTALSESDVFWDPITETHYSERPATVYDIATSDGHFILAEGNLVTHNSQLLMYTAELAPRGLYTSGKGSTAAGLTAAVLRDSDTGDMTLEAGALVLADRGVACLHPSMKVIFDDRIVAVGSLFNEDVMKEATSSGEVVQICPVRGRVKSFDIDELDSVDDECTLVRRKRYGGTLVRAKLASGFEVMLTPDHRLVDGNSLQWKEMGLFKPGESVLAPLRIVDSANSIYIFDMVPDDWIVVLKRAEKDILRSRILQTFKNLAEFNRYFGVTRHILSGRRHFRMGKLREILSYFGLTTEWRQKLLGYGRSKRGETLKVNQVTPELAYLIGFVYGDGDYTISRRRSRLSISQSIKKGAIINNLHSLLHSVSNSGFNRYYRTTKSKIGGRTVVSKDVILYCGSNLLTHLTDFFLRDDLRSVLRLSQECTKAFVSGALDADGCVSIKSGTKHKKVYRTAHVEFLLSDSREKDLAFILALRKLDIYARLRRRRGVNVIRITGRKDVQLLCDLTSAYSIKTSKAFIPKQIHEVSSASDKLPSQAVSQICKAISFVNKSKLLQKGIRSTIFAYKNNKCQPSREQLLKIARRIGDGLPTAIVNEVNRITKRDYFLDKIVSINQEHYNGWVYDLYVKHRHVFVGNGVLMHNCVDEFDKMNPQDRVAIHQAMEQQSYHALTEVALADGTRETIGGLVDSLFLENKSSITQGVKCEILDARPLNIEVLTTDFRQVERIHVDRLSRHVAPDHFLKIVYSNGREILVTPEHPIFVFKGAGIATAPAAEIRAGDFVPAPRVMPAGHNPGAALALPTSVHFNAKPILLPDRMTPKLARILGYFVTEGFTHFGSSAELGFSNTSDRIIADITDLMRELFGLEAADYLERDRTIRYISAQVRDLFKSSFPQIIGCAAEKRIPPQLFNSGKQVALSFLQSAFLGDGSVESDSVCYRTSSYKLACDYQDLLLCVGIRSRIVHDSHNDSYKVYICGCSLPLFFSSIVESWDPRKEKMAFLAARSEASNYDHDVFPPGIGVQVKRLYQLVGRPYRGTFQDAIKKGNGITRRRLQSCLDEVKERLSEGKRLLNENPKTLRDARLILRWSQETAAREIGVTRGCIDYAERNGYSAEDRQKLIMNIAKTSQRTCEDIEQKIRQLETLFDSEMCCLRVKRVEWVRNRGKSFSPFVYDITVEPNHCFISHGVVLHNTISIAKAGIVATLNARTAILAAANPALGRYNTFKNPAENITLPVTVLSRFDLIFVMVDKPESERDRKMAEHVLSLHSSKATSVEAPIQPQLLRKYISYAKRNTAPILTPEAANKIREFYLETRAMGENPESPVPITARQLEALVRLSESRAKMALKKEITVEDAEAVIRLMNTSLKMVGIDTETGRSDIDTIMVGTTKTQRERLDLVLTLVRELEEGSKEGFVQIKAIVDAAVAQGIGEKFAKDTIDRLIKEGVLFQPRQGVVKKT